MIVLYGPQGGPPVRKVALALALKALPYELVEPLDPEDYRRLSPETGLLPVLEIDSERRHDSRLIVEWLDERFPDPPLISPDPRVARQQRHLAEWVDEAFFWYWKRWQSLRPDAAPSASAAPGDPAEGGPPAADPPRPAGVSLRDWLAGRLRPERNERSPELERLVYELEHRVADIAGLLADRPFFYSDEPSLADLSVYADLGAFDDLVLTTTKPLTTRHANLARFFERMARTTADR